MSIFAVSPDNALGNKAQELLSLRAEGFPVPPLVCVPSDFLEAHTDDEARLILKNEFRDIKDNVFPNTELFSVRSSASAEDGAKHSFAGQFQTLLNVPTEAVADAILSCHRSKADASAYCAQCGISPESVHMNVIVQRMIPAERSGVMFSANPKGILNETVISVGYGTGDGVVDGRVSVTTWYINKTDGTRYYELEDGAPHISDNELDMLMDLCAALEKRGGGYLDIEFAFADGELYLLQCRKITTLTGERPLILDNSNIVESYPGLSLPLTVSFVREAYTGVFSGVAMRVVKNKRIVRRNEEMLRSMVGSANGRIYYKISNWYTVLRFLPCSSKIIPMWQEMMGVSVRPHDEAGSGLNPFQRILTYFNVLWEALRVRRNMEKLNSDFCELERIFDAEFPKCADIPSLRKLYDVISRRVLSVWDITLLNDMYAFVFTALLKRRLARKSPETGAEAANRFITGISNLESMKPVRAMLELTRIAAAGESLPTSDEETEAWLNGENGLCVSVREYINRYGDRVPEELKLETVTFREKPLLLMQKLARDSMDVSRLERSAQRLHEGGDELTGKCDVITRILGKKAAIGIRNREISRLNRTRIYSMVRRIFHKAGEIMAHDGAINCPRDIFMLTVDEVFRHSHEDFHAAVNKRREDYAMFALLPASSRLIFEKTEFDRHHLSVNSVPPSFSGDALRGTPCADGTVRAEAVVVLTPSEASDVSGKIIVARMTDPGWVFMLTTAVGIISEKGSLLSHTAIISRELGLPAVTGAANACDRIRTGDIVEMNGATGEIRICTRKDGIDA